MAIYDFLKSAYNPSLPFLNIGAKKEQIKKAVPPRFPRVKGKNAISRAGGIVTEDFLKSLQGTKGVKIYREMSMNDPVIGGILSQFSLRLRTTKWNVKTGDESLESQKLKRVLEKSLYGMRDPWSDAVANMVTFLTYGWALFEDIYGTDDDGLIVLKKLAFRKQTSLDSWEFNKRNIATAFIQRIPSTGEMFNIPLNRTFQLTTTPHDENPMGQSLLRTAYRPWFFKKTLEEIEGIGVERDLNGIPHIHFSEEAFDASANTEVVNYAEDLVVSIAKDNQQGVVTFPGMDLDILQGRASAIGTDKIIGRYDQRIALALAAQYLIVAFEARGSGTVAETYSDLMFDSIDAWATIMVDTFTKQIVDKLKIFNGVPNANVTILPSTLADKDKVDFAAFLSRLVRNGLVTPDDKLEEFIRDKSDLPDLDPDSARAIAGVIEQDIEKSEDSNPYFEVRDETPHETDMDGAKPYDSDAYAFECEGVILHTSKYVDLEAALQDANKYRKFGLVTIAKSEGKRSNKHIYKKITKLY